MNVRRSAAALAAIGVLAAAAPATAAGPSPSPKAAVPAGLFGKGDPTYDGVWRQSFALLAQHMAGERPAASAINWLVGQQCDNGAFPAFRADPSKPCLGKDGAQPDVDATAAAIQALQALGEHDGEVHRAVYWLKGMQNDDGGFGFAVGQPSDTNHTADVIGALTVAGENVTALRSEGKTPLDALAKWSVPCSADGGGAFTYQPDKKGKLYANPDATAAGVLGALGKGFVVEPGKARDKAPACTATGKPTPARLADNASAYLADALAENGHLMVSLAGVTMRQTDYANTADAVVALAATGATEQAKKPYAWLEKNAATWAERTGPAAYAELIFAAHAMGENPRDFGGTDLVRALDATGPAPQTAKARHSEAKRSEHGSGVNVWWIVGVGLAVGIGIGFLLRGRRKRQQP